MNYEEETLQIILTYLDTNCTIRDLATIFNISKTAVHNRLKKCEWYAPDLVQDVKDKAKQNKLNGTIKGGMTTKAKWLNKHGR